MKTIENSIESSESLEAVHTHTHTHTHTHGTSKRIIIYDVIRVIAVLLVLFGHSTYTEIVVPYGGVSYSGMNFSKLYILCRKIVGVIYDFHMPLFIFISGALFFRECQKKELKFEDICRKKFIKLIIPYLAYGILYNITIKYISKFYCLKNLPYAVINETLLGENIIQHIWFLPTLFLVTITFFVIYNGILQKNSKKLLALIIVFSLFVDVINITLPGIKFFPLLFIFFSLGSLFEENREKIEKYSKRTGLNIFFIILSFPIIYETHKLSYHVFNNIAFLSGFFKCLMTLSMVVSICLLAYLISKLKFITESKLFNIINYYSFDIYIIGDPLNYVVLYLVSIFGLANLYETIFGTILLISVRTIGIAIISFCIAKVIGIFKSSKYFKKIIGTILIVSIVSSMVVIIFNSVMKIQPEPYIFEVIEGEE